MQADAGQRGPVGSRPILSAPLDVLACHRASRQPGREGQPFSRALDSIPPPCDPFLKTLGVADGLLGGRGGSGRWPGFFRTSRGGSVPTGAPLLTVPQ